MVNPVWQISPLKIVKLVFLPLSSSVLWIEITISGSYSQGEWKDLPSGEVICYLEFFKKDLFLLHHLIIYSFYVTMNLCLFYNLALTQCYIFHFIAYIISALATGNSFTMEARSSCTHLFCMLHLLFLKYSLNFWQYKILYGSVVVFFFSLPQV